MWKKFTSYALCLSFLFTIFLPKYIYANGTLLYQEKEVQTITDGVVFEESHRLYKSGWKDIYVLTADLTNPNVAVDILSSNTEYGLKKSVENLTKENGAIAGFNADFFGSGNPASSMGQVIKSGNVVETQNYYNGSENKYAGLFIDKFGSAFVDYIKANIKVETSKTSFDLQAKNKVTDFKKPVIFFKSAISNTVDLDKRNKELFKIVVENNIITRKAVGGENVDIPENGYIVVMNKSTADEKFKLIEIGDVSNFSESYKFVFRDGKNVSEILTGISGGGEILRNGKQVSQGLSISPKVLNPRTALGVSKEKDKLILIAVDGRGASVGANHSEMASLLTEYGAYDAIHLDGGGSTTVALREEGKKEISLINNVSEKSQRSVPNAIGIKSNNQTGELSSLKIKINDESGIMTNLPYKFEIFGYDSNKNPVDLDLNQVTVNFLNEEDGTVLENTFNALKVGDLTLKAVHSNGAFGEITFKTIDGISSLEPIISNYSLDVLESVSINLSGVNKDGFRIEINPSEVNWTVDNEELGYIESGKFYAKAEGVATLTATYKGISTNVTIAIGNEYRAFESFEQGRNLFMMYFPENIGVSGGAGITDDFGEGEKSLILSYNFKENIPTPQASYVAFEKEPIILPGEPSSVRMMVKGDFSMNLLKAVLKDKNDNQYIIPIIDEIDSDSWDWANFDIPSEVAYPVRLDKLYVATLSTTEKEQGSIYIDNLQAVFKKSGGGVITNGYRDYLKGELLGTIPSEDEEDINVFGQTAIKNNQNSKKVLEDTINIMQPNSKALIFAGDTNLEEISTEIPTIQWNNKYYTTNTNNVSIINLATKSGNMRTESPDQWRWLQSYLENQSKNNIIINMDKDIWSSSYGLTGVRENQLFHKILKNFVSKTGKNVIVISAIGDTSKDSIKEGIRYITLNGLTNPTQDIKNYKYLKIRATKDTLKYQILDVYN